MNQWKVEEATEEVKCVACERTIAIGDRKVVVVYGARKNYCIECGKTHLAEKKELLEKVMDDLVRVKPQCIGFSVEGSSFRWEDDTGGHHAIVSIDDDGYLVLHEQTEGSPMKVSRARKPVIKEA